MSLQVWLPLNGDLHNQGLIDASFSNSNATIDTAGKIGSCYSFNGTDAQIYAVHDKSIWNNKPMTLCAWFKYVEGSTRATIIDIAADLVLSYEKNNSGLYFRYWRSYTNSNGARAGEVHSTLPNYYDVNAWHHVAYVAENNLNYIYVDGALALTFESSLYTSNFKPLLGSTYNRVSIAKSQGNSLFASGLVNDVRVYDNALSPLEVKHLAQGLVLHYPLNRGGFGKDNLLVNTDFSGVSKKYTLKSGSEGGFQFPPTSWERNTEYTVSCRLRGNANMNLYLISSSGNQKLWWVNRVDLSTTDYRFFSITFTSRSDRDVSNLYICTRYGTNNSSVGDWFEIAPNSLKLEKGPTATPWTPAPSDALYSQMGLDNNIEYDVSGYKHNGTKVGSITYDSNTPRYNTSAVFNGSSYIKNTDFNLSHGIWTVAAWYYLPNTLSSYNCILCLSKGNGSDANKKFAMCPNTSYIWFKLENTSISVNSALKVNQWTHITLTSDGINGKVYVNGQQAATTNITSIDSDCTDLVIGARANVENATTIAVPLSGLISDVRIYTTALSADDVRDLYSVAASVSNNGTLMASEVSEL